MSDPEVIADRERYAEVGREYRAARAGRASWPSEWRRRRRTTPRAREELLAEDGDDPELREVLRERARARSRSSRRRSAWRWSSATPTTTRT